MKRLLVTTTIFIAAISASLWVGYGIRQSQENAVGGSDFGTSEAIASEAAEKAGMVDPKNGKTIKYWAAPMDPTYIRYEPGKSPMGMDLVPVYEEEGGEKLPASTIRIDPVTVQNMGVRLATVERKPLAKTIRAFGNITYNETKIYAINTKFSGWIEKLYVDFEGTEIKKGQPLFDIYSPELVSAQEEYLLALNQYKSLSSSDYPSVRNSSERLLNASVTRLRYWDLTENQINEIEKNGTPKKLLTIYSPANGVVIKKKAIEGYRVKSGEDLFEIADLSQIWVDVDVYEYELPWIKAGMPAEMDLAYVPGTRFKGKVLYIYPYLNSVTRTATLRLEFPNPDSQLKPDMHANIYLSANLPDDGLVIPHEAIIDSGVRKIIFVALGEGKFEPREVTLGIEGNESEYQVVSGLREGEQIVISAQFMLDSESRLREAIQKMLEAKDIGSTNFIAKDDPASDDDFDMSSLSMDSMDDDLDMTEISMDDSQEILPKKQL